MYGYIYKTTNLINGRKYVGLHKSEKFDNSYKGSGKVLMRALKKYGKENFKTVIIDTANSLKELFSKEIFWIEFLDCVNSTEYYNIKQGGQGAWKINGVSIKKGKKISEQARRNTSEAHKGIKHTKETRQKMSISHKGERNGFYGKTFSDETLKRFSKLRKGRIWVKNLETNTETTIYPEELQDYLDKGFIKGRLFARGKKK